MSDQTEVSKAREAAMIIESLVYQEAMQSLKDQITRQWKECPIRDSEGQVLLLQLAKLADKFDGIMRGYVEAGKVAQKRIDLDQERNEPVVRKWFRKVA